MLSRVLFCHYFVADYGGIAGIGRYCNIGILVGGIMSGRTQQFQINSDCPSQPWPEDAKAKLPGCVWVFLDYPLKPCPAGAPAYIVDISRGITLNDGTVCTIGQTREANMTVGACEHMGHRIE